MSFFFLKETAVDRTKLNSGYKIHNSNVLFACVSGRSGIESSLESQTEAELTGQQSDDASLPSTSTDPGNPVCPLAVGLNITIQRNVWFF